MAANTLSVREVLGGQGPKDAPATVRGWVRTRRDSKAGFSFIHVSDGSSFHPVQVVAPGSLPNYADEILRLTSGCAVEATGMIVPSPAKGQPFEMQASAIKVIDLDKKRDASLKYITELSPRERADAVARMQENSLIVQWVQQCLERRVSSYRWALERLVLQAPDNMAAEADRLINELAAQTANPPVVTAPVITRPLTTRG